MRSPEGSLGCVFVFTIEVGGGRTGGTGPDG
jgi:hypothetical protein